MGPPALPDQSQTHARAHAGGPDLQRVEAAELAEVDAAAEDGDRNEEALEDRHDVERVELCETLAPSGGGSWQRRL